MQHKERVMQGVIKQTFYSTLPRALKKGPAKKPDEIFRFGDIIKLKYTLDATEVNQFPNYYEY